jgi:thymidine kinase
MDNKRSGITTHDGDRMDAIEVPKLVDALKHEDVLESRYVIIDEGQFFDDLVEGCEMLLAQGKNVVVTALSGDRSRNPFPVISNLISKADYIQFVTAICARCGADASFSYCRIRADGQKLLGGEDIYEARCRTCYERGDEF